MSIIRYRFKADKNFESVKIDGMSCSLGELKRLIAAKSSRSGAYHPKDDYDLIISNSNTHEEYKDNSDLIPRNASVIVARRIRGAVDTLTPLSNQRQTLSSDDIVKDILLPAMYNQNPTVSSVTTTATTQGSVSSSNADNTAATSGKKSDSANTAPAKDMTEDELIKEIQAGSHARYVMSQPSYRANVFVCHNCKQPGHMKNQCPLILQSSKAGNTTTNSSATSASATDGSTSTSSNSARSTVPPSSHIVTRHAPYQMPFHYQRGRGHRGAGHPRGEPMLKKTTGIPRDRLIPVSIHIPGALRDQTGASVIPQEIADLYVSKMGKKVDLLAQAGRPTDDKTNLASAVAPTKLNNHDVPPNDLLCPLCKQIFTDAVITPCCNFSFCDDCIRTALIDSPDHECPHCHCQHVAIDQINPNLYLRNHIKQWHERQNQAPYSHVGNADQAASLDQDADTNSTNASNSIDTDEYDPTTVPTNIQPSVPGQKAAPIVIKMQPFRKSQSPQPVVSTRPADMTFEDEKISDIDHTTPSQKEVNTVVEEPKETVPVAPVTEIVQRPEPETPPAQVAPVNPTYPSPTLPTTMVPANPVSHYYPVPPHHNTVYAHHIPPATSNGLYPMQPNYYATPPMGVRYTAPAGMPHYPPYPPAPPIHHHPIPPPPPLVVQPHIAPNGYNMPGFHSHVNVPYTSTSTYIAHHQTATQPISTALSENEFYTKQRYFQRMQSSPSRRSPSSSYSSYSSSDSRSSSRSRYNRRRRRSSRSRSRSRRREKSPIRDNRRQRRSSSYRNRRRPLESSDKHSSKYRRSPPRPSRDHERRRSPRPPPTIQQSTQRTIVYLQESSHSSRDRRRSKSRSRGNDDRPSASSKKEAHSETKVKSNSPPVKAPPALSSKIETVVEDALDSVQEDSSKNGKKHKKHKKHRHSSSKSKKRHRSKDKEKKTIVDTTTSVIEFQS